MIVKGKSANDVLSCVLGRALCARATRYVHGLKREQLQLCKGRCEEAKSNAT